MIRFTTHKKSIKKGVFIHIKAIFILLISVTVLFGCDDNQGIGNEETRSVGPNGLPLIYLTPEALPLVLDDFDYMMDVMLENAPSQGIFERRFGVTMEDFLLDMRELITDMEPIESLHFILLGEDDPRMESPTDTREIAADYLSSLLVWMQIAIDGLGHFGPQTIDLYVELLEANAALLHQTEIVDGRIVYDGEVGGDARSLQHLVEVFSSEATLWFYGIEFDDLDLEREMSDIGFKEDGNVVTEIIEENRVALVSIGNFINNAAFDSEVLFPFLEEVSHFEHLIIDLRENGGGFPNYFSNYVVAKLIDEPINVQFNEFLTAGDGAVQQAEFSLLSSITHASADEIISARDFIENQNFPYFKQDDLSILQYVIQWHLTINPREDSIAFEGDVWLLVDQTSASASELAAIIALESGFATVVGTQTMGVTPAMALHTSLPNTGVLFRIDTGYLIDSYGRSLEEYGVTPDIIVPMGENILEFVLDLIN